MLQEFVGLEGVIIDELTLTSVRKLRTELHGFRYDGEMAKSKVVEIINGDIAVFSRGSRVEKQS